MSDIPLTYAGVSYYDRTRALQDGSVMPEGFRLQFEPFDDIDELFRIGAQESRFDATEMSVSTLIIMMSKGDSHLVGLPVFLSRAFRHREIYVHSRSGIDSPHQLRGRNIGVLQYQMTAALWIRAILQHEYGVFPHELHWWTGGLYQPTWKERFSHGVAPNVVVDHIPEGRWLEEMLEKGDLDALATVRAPRSFTEQGKAPVRRLFPNSRLVEEQYFDKSGFFPIMHTVAVRCDYYEAHPEVAVALTLSFEEAKRQARKRLADVGTLAVMHPWIDAEMSRLDALGGGDMFAYGFAPNRAVIDAMTQYSLEQGLSERKVEPEELFAPETLDLHFASL